MLRVLELGDYVSAAYCTKLLVRGGAEVIKLELPGGDLARNVGPFSGGVPHPETSALYLYLNGGKKSVTLNYLTAAGVALLGGLQDQCDVIVCNLAPKLVEGLDLCGYASRHPEKVVVSLTPFGLAGPYSHFESTVGVALALGGYMFLMGDQGRQPLAMPGWYPEYQAGAYAYVGALAAWLGRGTRPVGGILEVSTMEALVSLHQFTTVQYTYAGQVRKRNGNRWDRSHPITLMPCQDGWIGLCVSGPAFWERFSIMIGHPELAEDPRFQSPTQRRVHADELDAVIGPWLRERTGAELLKEGQEVWRVPVGSGMTVQELLVNQHLAERCFWQEVEHPLAGRLKYPSSPFRMELSPPQEARVPLLGEHNQEIYKSFLGLSTREQTRLRQMGVI